MYLEEKLAKNIGGRSRAVRVDPVLVVLVLVSMVISKYLLVLICNLWSG